MNWFLVTMGFGYFGAAIEFIWRTNNWAMAVACVCWGIANIALGRG